MDNSSPRVVSPLPYYIYDEEVPEKSKRVCTVCKTLTIYAVSIYGGMLALGMILYKLH